MTANPNSVNPVETSHSRRRIIARRAGSSHAAAKRSITSPEPLQAHEVVSLHLLEPLPDERLGRLELWNHAILEGVDAPFHLLDLLDQPAHRRLDFCRHDDVLDEGLVRLRGLVDPRGRRDDSIAAFFELLADRL